MPCFFGHKWSQWSIEQMELTDGRKPLIQIRHCTECNYMQHEAILVTVSRSNLNERDRDSTSV